MRWKLDIFEMEFDYEGAKKALLDELQKANKKCGRAWLDAVVEQTPIPTWSGASRATFQKLAGDFDTTIPIGPIRASKSGVAWGRASSGGSGILINKQNGYVGFQYRTTLRHLIYNNYNAPSPGPYPRPWSINVRNTPYFISVKGDAAWNKCAATVRLPDPFKHIKRRSIG